MVQLLAADGTRTPHASLDAALAGSGGEDDLASPERLRGYYRDMVMIRGADLEATNLQRQGQLGLWASALGQEAAQIGAGHASREQDYLVPTYREHGIAWARGIEPWRLAGVVPRGKPRRLGPERRCAPTPTIIRCSSPRRPRRRLRHGAAARRRRRAPATPRPTPPCSRCSATAPRARERSRKSFTFAASFQAPVVFSHPRTTQWAISVPTSVQSRVPLAQRSRGSLGIPSVRVDGNDVLAVLVLRCARLLDAARAGEGPRFDRGRHLPHGRPHHE